MATVTGLVQTSIPLLHGVLVSLQSSFGLRAWFRPTCCLRFRSKCRWLLLLRLLYNQVRLLTLVKDFVIVRCGVLLLWLVHCFSFRKTFFRLGCCLLGVYFHGFVCCGVFFVLFVCEFSDSAAGKSPGVKVFSGQGHLRATMSTIKELVDLGTQHLNQLYFGVSTGQVSTTEARSALPASR